MVQVEVTVDAGESFDRALARFKKMCGKAGVVTEIKNAVFMKNQAKSADGLN